jgi:hypothetical protein
MVYIINSMFEIEMEPEIVTWLDTLTFAQYQRVMRNVDDYLVTEVTCSMETTPRHYATASANCASTWRTRPGESRTGYRPVLAA